MWGERVREARCAPLGPVTVAVAVGLGTWRPLPLLARSRLPQCVWGLPVAWNQPQNATRCFGVWGRGTRDFLAALDWEGGSCRCTPTFLAQDSSNWELPAEKTAEGGRRRCAACCRSGWAELAWVAGGGCSVAQQSTSHLSD